MILIVVSLKTAVSGMGRCVLWCRFTDISKKPAASIIKIDQPPIYSAGEGSRFFSNTCICHHIPAKFILISISQPCSGLPSGLFLSGSRPFKSRTSDTGWVQGGAAGSDTAPQANGSWVQFLMGSFGFFIDFILPTTQPLTAVSTRSISRAGKAGQCAGLTTLPPSCADCLEILAAC